MDPTDAREDEQTKKELGSQTHEIDRVKLLEDNFSEYLQHRYEECHF